MAKKDVNIPPEGKIRRSQVVTTYGPGSMVDLVDQAALVGGLDYWSYDRGKGSPVISEPRLRDRLAEQFKQRGLALSVEKAFREPPVGNDREPAKYAGISALEFPQWFVCQNPKCRALLHKNTGLRLQEKKKRYVHDCGSGGRPWPCVPVRFVGACRRGHLQDWPWVSFAHLSAKGGRCGAPSLRLLEGATGDFSEVIIECICGAREPLASAVYKLSEGVVLFGCDGHRPWLGAQGREECEEPMRLLVRTASNSYFSQVVSALSVPDQASKLDDAIGANWQTLQAATTETLGAFRTIPDVGAALEGWTDSEVLDACKRRKAGDIAAREPLRTAEFKQFIAQPEEQRGERAPADEEFFARRVPGELPTGIKALIVAPKLREVRAQIGFTRLEPASPDLQGEFDLNVESAALGLTTDWLPATEILGEGVFLQLDEEAVLEWEKRPVVRERENELRRGYEQWLGTLKPEAADKVPLFLGARYYLLHSLSHLLISAISLECGYSASSIRERIYCGPSQSDPDTPMAAILLSTGSSGTDGTLGGLVEQGRRIHEHLREAWRAGRLCANDPVCAAHSPADDPAERFLEGAGCHGCLFIAETSCERFNRCLDRALVVPTVGRPRELAFFRESP